MNQAKTDDSTPLLIAAKKCHLFVVKLLLDREDALIQANNDGTTLLYIAAQKGHFPVVQGQD